MLVRVFDRRQVIVLLVLCLTYGSADESESDKSRSKPSPVKAHFMEYSYEMPMYDSALTDDAPKPIVHIRYGKFDGSDKKPMEVRSFGIPITQMRAPIPVYRRAPTWNQRGGDSDPFDREQFQKRPDSRFEWHQPTDFFETFDDRFDAPFRGFPRFSFPQRPHWPDFDGFFEAFEHDVAENTHKVFDEHRRSTFEEETGRHFHHAV
uniref:Uncharacterized protein n=1 Tax=Panagrellus redivivus TaxID=6233 RepID=A0A7E4VFU8_PANRE